MFCTYFDFGSRKVRLSIADSVLCVTAPMLHRTRSTFPLSASLDAPSPTPHPCSHPNGIDKIPLVNHRQVTTFESVMIFTRTLISSISLFCRKIVKMRKKHFKPRVKKNVKAINRRK